MKTLKQIILITFISLVLIYRVYSQELYKDVLCNSSYCSSLDIGNFDTYLNYRVFQYNFNQIYGKRTGVPISVLVHDQEGFTTPGQHGYDMLLVGSKVRISDDVEFIPVYLYAYRYNSIPGMLKNNTKVYNASFGTTDPSFITMINELQKRGIFVSYAAGNNPDTDAYYNNFIKNNIHTDNFLVVGEIEIYPTPTVYNGNYPITDFSIYAGVYYDGTDGAGIGGTSAAAITVSTIIAQYYSIRPCWSYKDMKKFIYATLRPTSELGITNDQTKTKKYLKYDISILDDSFVQSLGLSTCADFNGFGNITQPVNNQQNSNQSINNQENSEQHFGIIGNTILSITNMFGRLNNRSNNNNTNNNADELVRLNQELRACSNTDYHCLLNTTNAILKINPDDAKALGVRAAAYAGLGDEKKAKRDIERAIQLSPNDASLLNMQNIINNTF